MKNLVDILRDAPKGLELWCDVYGKVWFEKIKDDTGFPLVFKFPSEDDEDEDDIDNFTEHGAIYSRNNYEYPCVLWPSEDHRSWEDWQKVLFKAGDVIVRSSESGNEYSPVLFYRVDDQGFIKCFSEYGTGQLINEGLSCYRYATSEETSRFFVTLEKNGYELNKKTLRLVKIEKIPHFKKEQWVWYKDPDGKEDLLQIVEIENEMYRFSNGNSCSIASENRMRAWTIGDAKDGDVLYSIWTDCVTLFKGINKDHRIEYYCIFDPDKVIENQIEISTCNDFFGKDDDGDLVPANKTQRTIFFDQLNEAGYEWNAEKKELKTIPKTAPVCNKFDVNTLKPFDKVLVRHNDFCKWKCTFFSHVDPSLGSSICCVDSRYVQCIPFSSETERLLGTSKKCDPFYEYWKESPNI